MVLGELVAPPLQRLPRGWHVQSLSDCLDASHQRRLWCRIARFTSNGLVLVQKLLEGTSLAASNTGARKTRWQWVSDNILSTLFAQLQSRQTENFGKNEFAMASLIDGWACGGIQVNQIPTNLASLHYYFLWKSFLAVLRQVYIECGGQSIFWDTWIWSAWKGEQS